MGVTLMEKETPRVRTLIEARLTYLDEKASNVRIAHLRDKTQPDSLGEADADEYRTLQGLYHRMTGRHW